MFVNTNPSYFFFLRNQSSHLRLTSSGVFFERIYFYGKMENPVEEVFSNDFPAILWFFTDPFMHYVRYQGKSILVSKDTPLLMNKWKYYLVLLFYGNVIFMCGLNQEGSI